MGIPDDVGRASRSEAGGLVLMANELVLTVVQPTQSVHQVYCARHCNNLQQATEVRSRKGGLSSQLTLIKPLVELALRAS